MTTIESSYIFFLTLTKIAYHDSYDIREMGVFAFKYLHEKGNECKEIKQRKEIAR